VSGVREIQCVANVLECVAVCYGMLQCVLVCCSVFALGVGVSECGGISVSRSVSKFGELARLLGAAGE